MDLPGAEHRKSGALTETTKVDSDSVGSLSGMSFLADGESLQDAPPTNNICCLPDFTERVLYILALLWVVCGILVFMYGGDEEDRMSFIAALYLVVQIATTVGYGDICPRTDSMKLFMAMYVNFGIMFGAFGISTLATKIVSKVHTRLKESLTQGPGTEPHHQRLRGSARIRHLATPMVSAFLVYCVFFVGGAFFYRLVSTCHCLGCEVTYPWECEEAGGNQRNFVDAIYMSAITLSTVGFGDTAPGDHIGRIFSIPWMLFGVASLANLVSEMIRFLLALDIHWERTINPLMFYSIDRDHNGVLSRYEYITYMLVRYGVISEDDLEGLNQQFDALDRDGDNVVSYEEAGLRSNSSSLEVSDA